MRCHPNEKCFVPSRKGRFSLFLYQFIPIDQRAYCNIFPMMSFKKAASFLGDSLSSRFSQSRITA